nr:ATP-binding cassette domain-containing protein [Candidatus Sigynarchaeota archaeon]
TLLNIIGLLEDPTTGEVRFGNQRVDTWQPKEKLLFRREHVGFIFQNSNLFPNFTVYQNLLASLQYTTLNRAEKDERICMYLKKIRFEEKKNALPDELSGGQKQWIAVVAALIKKPSIVIADEPTAELDIDNKKRVMSLIFELQEDNKDCCIIIASHDMLFEEKADFIIKLQDGLKIADRCNAKQDEESYVTKQDSHEIERKLHQLIEFRLLLRCPKCNSTNIKKITNEEDATVKIVGDNAIGMATVFCLDCNHGETKNYILHKIFRT